MIRTTILLLSISAAAFLAAQEPPQPPAPETPNQAQGGRGGGGRGGAAPSAEPQPYEKVITKEAKSKKGIFTVHQIKEKYYYEIPKSELDKEFLWNTQISKTTLGVGYGGDQLADRVVRWQLRGNQVNLRDVNYSVTADPKLPIALAVQAANNNTILMSFPVAAFSKDGDPVIEVTRLFTTDIPEFSMRQRLGATAMDASRSYIERISPYPENVEAEATLTYTRTQAPGAGGRGGEPVPTAIGGGQMRPGSATIVVHHSMVKLPEKPMMPRVFDERVGYFTTSQYDFGKEEQRAPRVRYIARWRLDKQDPKAALSDPVKPIVYYIDAATPVKWREWLKRGVESWEPAFEAAGFKNAIIAKMAPTAEEDPDFSPEDVRYSVIRWLPSTVENAVGPHISDPRTGEILNADIQFFHNVMNLQRDWYFLQVGPLDPRAQKLPLPDELMGRLLEFVVAHEVGHTLGFQHNMKASSMYPQEKIRDKDWVHKMGHTPSIMDYARFNYVAQPEDGIAVEDLVPRVGPYDIWATHWGYTPITGAKTPEEERTTLDGWSKEQDQTPWFRFSTAGAAGSDPGELDRGRGRCRRREIQRARLEEPPARRQNAAQRHHRPGRRDLRRPGRNVRPHAGPVDARNEPRGRHRGRLRIADQVRGAAGARVPAGCQRAGIAGAELPRRERLRHAQMGARSRGAPPHRAGGRHQPRPQRAVQHPQQPAQQPAFRAPGRAGGHRRQYRPGAVGFPGHGPQEHLERAGRVAGEDRCFPARLTA